MRRIPVIIAAAALALAWAAPAVAAQSASVAALQVALRSKGFYAGTVDGISGPMTRDALLRFQRKHGIRATGKIGMATRCKLGTLGTPLLGQRQLQTGRVGWDVTSLEFRLRRFGLAAKRVDGKFDAATRAALQRFQRARGLTADGVAGAKTFRALARGGSAAKTVVRVAMVHRVRPGEGFSVLTIGHAEIDRAALLGRCRPARDSPAKGEQVDVEFLGPLNEVVGEREVVRRVRLWLNAGPAHDQIAHRADAVRA